MFKSAVLPVRLYGEERLLRQHGADQGVHLRHVATKPKYPAACRGEDERNLGDPSVRILWHEEGADDADDAPEDAEDDDRDGGGPHRAEGRYGEAPPMSTTPRT